jgi:hypothetical protein
MVSRRPVSQSERRGLSAPICCFRATKFFTLRRILSNRSRPRTSSNAFGSAASSEMRISSSPASISSRLFFSRIKVPLVLNST